MHHRVHEVKDQRMFAVSKRFVASFCNPGLRRRKTWFLMVFLALTLALFSVFRLHFAIKQERRTLLEEYSNDRRQQLAGKTQKNLLTTYNFKLNLRKSAGKHKSNIPRTETKLAFSSPPRITRESAKISKIALVKTKLVQKEVSSLKNIKNDIFDKLPEKHSVHKINKEIKMTAQTAVKKITKTTITNEFILTSASALLDNKVKADSPQKSKDCTKNEENAEINEKQKIIKRIRESSLHHNKSNFNPPKDSIFFVETSGNAFNARQMCAVESAALNNKNRTVYLLALGNIDYKDEWIQCLRATGNVIVRHLDFGNIFKATPLEEWFKNEIWTSSNYLISHISDALRFTVLWKFTGIYMDLDVVVTRSFGDVKNFAALEDSSSLVPGVIGFSERHPILQACVEELRDNFNGKSWAANGPKLLKRMFFKVCNVTSLSGKVNEICESFKILHKNAFYLIHYGKWKDMFEPGKDEKKVLEQYQESYLAHFWNNLSKNMPVKRNDNSLYDILARNYCPCVYNTRTSDIIM